MKGRVIGMVQTRPLPGSYRNRGERIDSITEQALEETRILAECGVQSVILQNMGDMPIRQQSTPEAIAYLSVVAQAIRRSFPRCALACSSTGTAWPRWLWRMPPERTLCAWSICTPVQRSQAPDCCRASAARSPH